MQILSYIMDSVRALIREESGQDAVEYLLVIGGISVGAVAAALLAPGIFTSIKSGVCDAIATIPNMTNVNC